jgi:hypothetical protein
MTTASPASSSTSVGSFAKARALAALQFSHAIVVKFASDIPADKALVLYGKNAENPDGHALWQIGHLANTAAWFAGLLDGGNSQFKLPEGYDKLFGMGSKPTSNAADYPSFDEVRAVLDAQYSRLLKAGSVLKDEELELPTLGDSGGFCPDRLSVLERAVFHNGWHVGQLSSCRKAIGLKPAFGS